MAHEDELIPESVRKALRRSGFPFQTAVAHHIPSARGSQLRHVEFSWVDPKGEERFVDLVAYRYDLYAVIECKKTAEDWIFLRPEGLADTGEEVTAMRVPYSERVTDPEPHFELSCATWDLSPASVVSEFCIVSKSDEGRTRLLERELRLLVQATEYFGRYEQRRLHTDRAPGAPPVFFVHYVPVLVTTAGLYSARYKPGIVSLESGEFPDGEPTEVRREPWVRVTKSLSAGREKQSAFVVSGQHTVEFLGQLIRPKTHLGPGPDIERLE